MLPAKSLSTLLTSSRISFLNEKTLDLITLHFKKMSNRKRTTGNGFVKRWWFFLKCKMCLPHNMVVVANFAISPHQKHDPKYGVTLLQPHPLWCSFLPCCNVAILLFYLAKAAEKAAENAPFSGDFFSPFLLPRELIVNHAMHIKDAKK